MKSATLSAATALSALFAAAALIACGDSGTSNSGGSGSGDAKFRAEEYCFLNADLAASLGVSDCAALTGEQRAEFEGHYEASGKAEGRWWNVYAQCSDRLEVDVALPCSADSIAALRKCSDDGCPEALEACMAGVSALSSALPCDFGTVQYFRACQAAKSALCLGLTMRDADYLAASWLLEGKKEEWAYTNVPADFSASGYCDLNPAVKAIYGPDCDERTVAWHYVLFGKPQGLQYKTEEIVDPYADYAPIATEPSFKIVGYVQTGTSGGWNGSHYKYATHLVVFGPETNANGDIVWKGTSPEDLKAWGYYGSKTDTRVMVAIGGWGKSNGFTAMANDATARENFVNQLAALKDYHVYGVDIDWENDGNSWPYPGSGVNVLLSDMAAKLHPLGMKVSVALASTTAGGFDATGAAAVDWINVMCYDGSNHGTFAKISSCKENYAGYQSKSVIGVPFYVGNTAYSKGASSEVVGLDGMATATNSIKSWGPGIMIWDLSHDKTDPESSLLVKIAETAGYNP